MDELLKEAENKYPAGTKVKSLGTGLVATSSGVARRNYVNDICMKLQGSKSNVGAIRVYSDKQRVWAERCNDE